jgi:hypothetical protein
MYVALRAYIEEAPDSNIARGTAVLAESLRGLPASRWIQGYAVEYEMVSSFRIPTELREFMAVFLSHLPFYRCPKSLEPMGTLIIFLSFIYRLKL